MTTTNTIKDIGEIASFTITTTSGKSFTFAADEIGVNGLRSFANAITWHEKRGAHAIITPNMQRLQDILVARAQNIENWHRANPF